MQTRPKYGIRAFEPYFYCLPWIAFFDFRCRILKFIIKKAVWFCIMLIKRTKYFFKKFKSNEIAENTDLEYSAESKPSIIRKYLIMIIILQFDKTCHLIIFAIPTHSSLFFVPIDTLPISSRLFSTQYYFSLTHCVNIFGMRRSKTNT